MKKYIILLSTFLSTFLLVFSLYAEGQGKYEVPETLLVEDFEDENEENNLGGPWWTFDDSSLNGDSTISFTISESPGYENSKNCAKIKWVLKKSVSNEWPFAGIVAVLKPDESSMDLSSYTGVRFYAKGNRSFVVAIPAE